MRFEWDEEKRRTNLRKHGIDFADVERVFEDETVTDVDERYDYAERRYFTLGMLGGRVVAISHTEEDDVVRLISCRVAKKYEEEIYYKEIRD